jgi:hypothetical protein
MLRKLATTGLVACALAAARPASAFLIVGTDAAQAPGPETRVLVLSEPGRSVVALSPSVRGPSRPLAVVVPLPAASASSLHSMPFTLFERTDKLAAPRLEELWELDPCELHADQQAGPSPSSSAAASGAPAAGAPAGATVEGNYEITVLSAADSANAAKWLGDHGYKVPDGADAALASIAKAGQVLAVARIDGGKLTFEKGVARLPPLGYLASGPLSLPLELAGLGASGAHDVIIDAISPARLEASNRLNLAVPTNLDANEEARGNADGLYRAVIDYALEKTPGAALTEYAWLATGCDGCAPGSAVTAEDLLGFGVEQLPSAEDGSQREVMVEVPESLSQAPEGPPELKRAIVACYTKTLGEIHGLAGEATVEVKTGDGGAVTSAKIKDAAAEALGKCVEEAAKATKLDKPNATGVLQARFALVSRAYLAHTVLSRVRVRTAKGAGTDLALRPAAPIEGGRELGPSGEADRKVSFAEHTNNFHARYVVRHPWAGPITCADPKRGVWGAKPRNAPAPGRPSPSPSASASASASGKAATPSAAEKALTALLEGGQLPDLQAFAIPYRAAEPPKPAASAAATAAPSGTTASTSAPASTGSAAPGSGSSCACRAGAATGEGGGWLAISAIGALAMLGVRRRRSL